MTRRPSQRPILTVTLNPAVDLAAHAEKVVPGGKLRLTAPATDPGGGGINVARAVHRLGGEAAAFVALAGAMGAQLDWLVRAEGVPLIAFEGPGETRHSLSVIAEDTGLEYRFVLPGADWDMARSEAALAAILEAVVPEAVVVLSGSQPPGVPDDFPSRLARALARQGTGTMLIVDTSGAALDRLIDIPDAEAPPMILRMDDAEAEATAGRALPAPEDTADYARALVARGVAQTVVVARGANGSVLVGPGGRLHCIPPKVEVASTVGAGDSFTGALTLALARDESAEAALRAGTAAAAAAVTTPGTELCQRADVERLLPGCRIVAL